MVQNTPVRNLDHSEQSANGNLRLRKLWVILSRMHLKCCTPQQPALSSLVVGTLGGWFMPTTSSVPTNISNYHTHKFKWKFEMEVASWPFSRTTKGIRYQQTVRRKGGEHMKFSVFIWGSHLVSFLLLSKERHSPPQTQEEMAQNTHASVLVRATNEINQLPS